MAIVEDEYIRIPIPFALPFLGLTEPSAISINKAQFQLFMRIVVFVCSAFLFWPKVKGAFGFETATDTEAQRKDIQERIAQIEHEKDVKDSKKSYAVVTGPTAGGSTSTKDKEAANTRRRKV